MKKEYTTPAAEKVEFSYSEAVVACSANYSPVNQTGQWGCEANICYETNYWCDNTGRCTTPKKY